MNTIGRVIKALEKIDAADFATKYDAFETDATKRTNAKAWLTEIQNQKIIVGSDKYKDRYGIEHDKQRTYDLAHTYDKYDKNTNTWSTGDVKTLDLEHFFEFIKLVNNDNFLKSLNSPNIDKGETWQVLTKGEAYTKDELVDYAIPVGANTTIYKTGKVEEKVRVKGGVFGWIKLANTLVTTDNQTKLVSAFTNSPNELLLLDLKNKTGSGTINANSNFIWDTNFALPESVTELNKVKDYLETEKLSAALQIASLTGETTKKVAKLKVKKEELTKKSTETNDFITKIILAKRAELTKYTIEKGFKKVTDNDDNRRESNELYQIQTLLLEIRYLENDGNAELDSSVTAENTALTEVGTIMNKVSGYSSESFFLVDIFRDLAYKKDGTDDIQQAISRIEAGKYKNDDGVEEDISRWGGLEKFKAQFENKEKLVKLNAWETKAKQTIENVIGKKSNLEEKLTDWQSKLKALDTTLDEAIITEEFKTKWGDVSKHQKITDVEKLLKEVKKDGTEAGKEYADFFNAVKDWTETKDIDTWAKLLAKEPKDIITAIKRYGYEKLSAADKVQKDRKIKKVLNKKGTDALTQEEVNSTLYEVAIGTKVLTSAKLDENLQEIVDNHHQNDSTKPFWRMDNYWIWGGMIGLLAVGGFILYYFWNKSSESSEKVEEEKETVEI